MLQLCNSLSALLFGFETKNGIAVGLNTFVSEDVLDFWW